MGTKQQNTKDEDVRINNAEKNLDIE